MKCQEKIDQETTVIHNAYIEANERYELLQKFVEKSHVSSYNQKIIDEMKEVLAAYKTGAESMMYLIQAGRIYVQRTNNDSDYKYPF